MWKQNRSFAILAPSEEFTEKLKPIESVPPHPHIVACLDAFFEEHDLVLMLEYADIGDLKYYLLNYGALGHGKSEELKLQITSAVAHVHLHKLAHRDIKPENIYICSQSLHETFLS